MLYEGRLEQFGPTVDVYQNPQTTRIAQAFSDPAMNFVAGSVDATNLRLGDARQVALQQHLNGLNPGNYQFGMRANHLQLQPRTTADVEFQASIGLAEISGSETFVHVTHNGDAWTVQQQGIHNYRMDEQIQVYVDPAKLYVFDLDGHLVASPDNIARQLT